MKRFAIAVAVAAGIFALSGTASAQYYSRGYGGGWGGYGGRSYVPGHYHYHPGHVHRNGVYHPGHYHYHAPRVIYSQPRYYQPLTYSYPGIGYPGLGYGYPGYYGGSTFSFGYARPGLSLGLSFIR
jgi:hypothetical protein